MQPFSTRIIDILQTIPRGTVTTYGAVAALAGNPAGARQVARLLHSSSEKYGIPWHRVVNREGRISPRASMSHLDQRILLEKEGVEVSKSGIVDLDRFMWLP